MIHILYFAWMRQKIGKNSEQLELPPNVQTIAGLIDYLCAQDPKYQDIFCEPKAVKIAVNQIYSDPVAPLRDGDEIAFFPPTTGG